VRADELPVEILEGQFGRRYVADTRGQRVVEGLEPR
jgi:hypothetical protein